ncbi:hypothetical protein COY14_02655 [Candidatus Roizmanbacteria bacterium CG_4_10_14_0_2_um_filter_36_9]|uniref:Uncharacterized protein n=1 Tax=Candidatus Roizmanbacteria bacterium CG_4_10_14_0_2_um_filter_36_9 TaxID=1974823 RepID=A0A2M7U3Y8_9BACT|nr:MAG: hypothetical protein COY14_02655 [Candidatus Roizmanbacteria bacterium CG_4_10_14_0_2_um_filter_36_9]
MNKDKILALLKDKKTQDYTFQFFFFVIFAVFVVVAIRPNLITAFNLQKELQDVKLNNKVAEEVIQQIVNYQSVIESERDKLLLLDDAVPSTPDLSNVVDQITQTASSSGLIVTNLKIENISFKGVPNVDEFEEEELSIDAPVDSSTPSDSSTTVEDPAISVDVIEGAPDSTAIPVATINLKKYSVVVTGIGPGANVAEFIRQITSQRRLKTIKSLVITGNPGEENKFEITINTYYI